MPLTTNRMPDPADYRDYEDARKEKVWKQWLAENDDAIADLLHMLTDALLLARRMGGGAAEWCEAIEGVIDRIEEDTIE